MGKLLTGLMAFILVLLIQPAFGQHEYLPTDSFIITGEVKNEVKFTLSDLSAFEAEPVEDVIITNHAGVEKGVLTGLKGIPIKKILDQAQIEVDDPKFLSEFYLTFAAIDGYKVVYSWNEIFNTATGDHTFLITQMEGKSIKKMEDRILVLTTSDIRTGRRNLKSLSKIIITRVE
uniref:Molybdopterin-binding protein n=1 Tax=Roseihalotalea indica TaxID=2867963 RepID=A0AA49GMK2_9BACT|nr:hypothetical protein K4G66_32370 [Tunicatimonas sp. TK19036]